mmetsp:Transcript_21083/g.48828  ORF Transcript_21083/g.48828 Transcript_21083/m.48828 type:complete len:220 (-) Transcript_21083:239-898(-)
MLEKPGGRIWRFFSLGLLVILHHGTSLILRHGKQLLELAAGEGGEQRGDERCRDQVQQRRLRALEPGHHDDGGDKRGNVRRKLSVEVFLDPLCHCLLSGKRLADVPAEEEGDEQPRDHNVSEAEHGELLADGRAPVAREHQLDGRLERLGHGHHHVRAENPEDVIDEKPTQQDRPVDEGANRQHLDAAEGEGDSEHVVRHPVVRRVVDVPDARDGDDGD